MGNAHIDSLKVSFYEGHKTGERIGEQRMMDSTMIYFARLGWSAEQVKAYFAEVNAIIDEYAEAFSPTQEQDVYQARMDEELKTVIDDCLPFKQRYPEIKSVGYDKPIKEQKHAALKKRRGK